VEKIIKESEADWVTGQPSSDEPEGLSEEKNQEGGGGNGQVGEGTCAR